MYEDCFARIVECRALKKPYCVDGECPFYKCTKQFEKELEQHPHRDVATEQTAKADRRRTVEESEVKLFKDKKPKRTQKQKRQCDYSKCFAMVNGKCRVLKETICNTADCPFYKTGKQREEEKIKYQHRDAVKAKGGGNNG